MFSFKLVSNPSVSLPHAEPEMNKVAFPHLEKLQREWREVAVLKWNVWKVELNLSWLLHAPPEENVDLNQAVMEYIQNGQKQHGHVGKNTDSVDIQYKYLLMS